MMNCFGCKKISQCAVWIAPSSIKTLGVSLLALAIFGTISTTLPLSHSIDPLYIYVPAIAAIILVMMRGQVRLINKVVFTALILLSSLSLTGSLPPMSPDPAIYSLSLGAVGTALSFLLYFLREKNKIRIIVDQMIEQVQRYPQKKQKIHLDRSFEHSMLYYEISKRIETTVNQEPWISILQNLNHKVVIHINDSQFTLDCSLLLSQIARATPDIEFIELTAEDLRTHPQWKERMTQILRESLNNIDDDYIDAQMRDNSRLFVGRNRSNSDDIYGGVFAQRKGLSPFFIHSLCKKASATRIKFTQKMALFLQTQDQTTSVQCTVEISNIPAQIIYKSLGFKIIQRKYFSNPPYYLMELQRRRTAQ